MGQYTRAVKQKEDKVRKHAQTLEMKKTAYDGAMTRHKAEMFDHKTSWKSREKDLRDTSRTEISAKSLQIRSLNNQVNQFERDKMNESNVLEKLKASLIKEKAAHSKLKGVYVDLSHKMDGLGELNNELSSSLKQLKKKY